MKPGKTPPVPVHTGPVPHTTTTTGHPVVPPVVHNVAAAAGGYGLLLLALGAVVGFALGRVWTTVVGHVLDAVGVLGRWVAGAASVIGVAFVLWLIVRYAL